MPRPETFTERDIIRLFLENLSSREQRSVLFWFKKVLQDVRSEPAPRIRGNPFNANILIRIWENNLTLDEMQKVIDYFMQFCPAPEPDYPGREWEYPLDLIFWPVEPEPDWPELPHFPPGLPPAVPLPPPGIPQLPAPPAQLPPPVIPIIIPEALPTWIKDIVLPEAEAADVPRETYEELPAQQEIMKWTLRPVSVVNFAKKHDLTYSTIDELAGRFDLNAKDYVAWYNEMEETTKEWDHLTRVEYFSEHDMVFFETVVLDGHSIKHHIHPQNGSISIEIVKVDGLPPGKWLEQFEGQISYLEDLLDILYNFYEAL